MSNKTTRQTRTTLPDSDLEIREGGAVVQTLKALVWSKNKGADPLGPSRESATGLFIPYQSLLAQCKGIQDSLGFWIPRCGYRIPGTGFQSFSMELGFWIPIVGGIPDSLSCTPNPHAKVSQIT